MGKNPFAVQVIIIIIIIIIIIKTAVCIEAVLWGGHRRSQEFDSSRWQEIFLIAPEGRPASPLFSGLFCNPILFAICTSTYSKLCKNMVTVA
jgi:hypothetical protein